ncbi:3-methyladenine DNA glycosylase [Sulfurimonas paralvinellae]|uniref:3-methyladenine DNA glycosylase n=1 Tax=Sulfurimonas paralvinellae TaxID=317658 RepID=A0A7M1B7V2_9BACT|nr:3-methyladenine DNA glycosylase [Sulfurimonas paralvinellae]QOP45771.1 3-methyladenine DNA glycosylase [Sulfurimonas paralvinellae]
MSKIVAEIYEFLRKEDLLQNSPPLWWPNAGTFEVVVSAVLTQNTTWKNVEKSLKNLEGFLTLESFLTLDEIELKEKIRPSGFYNQKAPRLLQLSRNIKDEFKNFETFGQEVSRKWLLEQKGIGKESADAILCYGCLREEVVVDSYTKRLLKRFEIEFKEYDDYKEYLESGLREVIPKEQIFETFALFHGMIVEYNKKVKL